MVMGLGHGSDIDGSYVSWVNSVDSWSALIESYIKDIFSWLADKIIFAIPNKTEYLVFNSRNINAQVININLDSEIIIPSYSAKNLGALFQSDKSLDNHISSIIKSCFE